MEMAEPHSPLFEDQALVDQAIAGDGLAFRKLVEPHLPMLFRLAHRVCTNPALAEDVVQETLVLGYQKLKRLRTESSFKAFLAGIAVRRALTLVRSESRRTKREQTSKEPEMFSSQEENLIQKQTAIQVQRALERLPQKRKQAALLRLDAGLSYKEIAQSMKTSERSARVLVHLALVDLRETLHQFYAMIS